MSNLTRLKDATLDHIPYNRQLVVPLIDTFDLHGARNRDSIRWNHALADWNRLLSDPEAIARFQSKLTTPQAKSWRLLQDWWNGEYSSIDWKEDIETWKKQTQSEATEPKYSGLGDIGDAKYPWCLSVLFFFEFVGFIYYNPRKEMIPYGAPEADVDLEQRKFAKLNTIRLKAAQHAVAQKLGWMALQDPGFQEVVPSSGLNLSNISTLGSSFHPCAWLDLPNVESGCRFTSSTRSKAGLYKPLIYENLLSTRASVTLGVDTAKLPKAQPLLPLMPDEFKACASSGLGRYYWFDLFCIPQQHHAESHPMRVIRKSEISRQGQIFRNARLCVIWLNDAVPEGQGTRSILWDATGRAIDYLGLQYLSATGQKVTTQMLERSRARSEGDDSIDLLNKHSGASLWDAQVEAEDTRPGPKWGSSLWTVQEAALRPGSVIATRDWKILSDRNLEPITYDDLMSLSRLVGDKVSLDDLPLGVKMLTHYFYDAFIGELTPVKLLYTCHQRICSRGPRADAIMSVLGCTDWWELYGDHPQQTTPEDLVMGKFPLPFIQEALRRIGPRFFFFVKGLKGEKVYSNIIEAPLMVKAIGSMLPFVAGHWRKATFAAPDDVFSKETSLTSWTIQRDGTVRIKHAAVYDPGAVSVYPADYWANFRYLENGRLQDYMDMGPKYSRDDRDVTERYAVYLQSNGLTRLGVIFEGLTYKTLPKGGKFSAGREPIETRTLLVKTAIFWLFPKTEVEGGKEAAPIPPERGVDWLIL